MTLQYFWQAGGFGMYQVALFGLFVLVAAGLFVYRPDERSVPFLRAMTVATLLAIAGAVVSNVATVFWYLPTKMEPAVWTRNLYVGLFESLTPAILGFAVLSFAWLLKAVGIRRLAYRLP